MKVEEAIKKAIQGGFMKDGKWRGNDVPPIHEFEWMALLSDWTNEYQFAWLTSQPAFWQSLAQSIGLIDYEVEFEEYGDAHNGKMPRRMKWESLWHRFIDHLSDGRDAEEFFKGL